MSIVKKLTELTEVCNRASQGQWFWAEVKENSTEFKKWDGVSDIFEQHLRSDHKVILSEWVHINGDSGIDIDEVDAKFIVTARAEMPKLIKSLEIAYEALAHINKHSETLAATEAINAICDISYELVEGN